MIALQELDLDGDFDPEKHDQQMANIYGQDDADEFGVDPERPTWDDDIDIADIVPLEDDQDEGPSDRKKNKKKKKKKKDAEDQEEDGVYLDEMDAEVQRPVDEDEWDGTEEMRKRKLDEYMDEIYGLEFNDIVRLFPTRLQ